MQTKSNMYTARPRVLVLTPRYPYPVIGGDALRIIGMCRELAKSLDLTLLSLCDSSEQLRAPPPQDGLFGRIERVLLPRWRSVLNVLRALPTATPLQVAYYQSKEFRDRLESLLPHHDACVAHLIRTGEYVRGNRVPCLLEMTDAISLNYARVKALGRPTSFKALVYAVEAGRLAQYERAILRDFPMVTLVSDTDREFLMAGQPDALGQSIRVCSNGVDLLRMPFAARREKDVAVFIGNMRTMQNLDACHFFAQEVVPVLASRREMVFRIVGSIGASDAKKLQRYPGVQVTGRVESVAEAVADAKVGVCPVRIGAGVQNKLLEYMALGLPAITSPVGLEGLGARPNEELLVAHSPMEWADGVESLLDDPERATRIARLARHYVESHHDWSTMVRPVAAEFASLFARGGCESQLGTGKVDPSTHRAAS